MTSIQRELISKPANGLIIFNTDVGNFHFYDGLTKNWKTIGLPSMTTSTRDAFSPAVLLTGKTIYNTTQKALNVWSGTEWINISGATYTGMSPVSINENNQITVSGGTAG